MDFAASEAKKRGQSFPGTSVNLRRERPGTNQPCPMRSTSAGRSDPGFVPGTPVDFAGTKNFFRPCGEQFAHKGYGYALPGHTHPGQRKRPICRAASLRGAIRTQKLWMCPARSHAAGTEKMPHLPGSQPAGSNSHAKTVDMLYPASAEGRQRKTKKAPGSDAFLFGADNRT